MKLIRKFVGRILFVIASINLFSVVMLSCFDSGYDNSGIKIVHFFASFAIGAVALLILPKGDKLKS